FQRGASAFAASVPADPADDGFFGPGSVTWRLHADLSAPVSGLRSLLLQALHPLAMAGVDQHSQWRDDPAGRFASPAAYGLPTPHGDRAAAPAGAGPGPTDPPVGPRHRPGDRAALRGRRPRPADLGARGPGGLRARRRRTLRGGVQRRRP